MMNYSCREDRKRKVLVHIVQEYVDNAVPVSSKTVAEKMGGAVSSATVRNIMAELEDTGFIVQPHTSAGRIPTNSGYRQYVDLVQDKIKLKKEEAERLKKEYDKCIDSIKHIIEKTSLLISHELHNAGIVMWPNINDFYLKHLELIKMKAETVLAVMVTVTNAVKNYIINLNSEIEKHDLGKISNYINKKYEGRCFSDIYSDLKSLHKDRSAGEESSLAKQAFEIIDSISNEKIENDIYWEGLKYFTEEPEFLYDKEIIKSMFELFNNRNNVIDLMKKEMQYEGIRVHIGNEDGFELSEKCSLITSGYSLKGRAAGRIGVIGPTRMNYSRALGIIDYLSELISLKLESLNG